MIFETDSIGWLRTALGQLAEGFAELPDITPSSGDSASCQAVLTQAAGRLQDNFPYFHPLYAGLTTIKSCTVKFS